MEPPHLSSILQAPGRPSRDALAVGRAARAGHGAAPDVARAVGGGAAAGDGCWDRRAGWPCPGGFCHEEMERNRARNH